MSQYIYADNAATTKLDNDAFEAMKPFLLNEYGNASALYSIAREPKKALKWAREVIASCIGAQPEEIFFTAGGTESDNWAIKGIATNGAVKVPTIVSKIEHHAVLRSCEFLEYIGYPVAYLSVDSEGFVCPESLKSIISPATKLVSIMLANNEIGTIEPITELAKIAHHAGSLFHTDAVQAVGHIHVDVNELGVDMLSASAHKFNGPKGVGFLFIKKETQIISYASGGSQESHMRAGTENVAGIVGMATALRKSVEAIDTETARLKELTHAFYSRLDASKLEYRINGSIENRLPGNINISFRGQSGEALLHRLDLKGICISTGSACNSQETEISHVIRAIDVSQYYAEGTVRITFGKENTVEESIRVAEELVKAIC